MHSDKKHGFKISVLFVLNVFVITQKSAADVFIHSASLSVFHCQDDILIVISVMLSEEVEPSFVFRSRFISDFHRHKGPIHDTEPVHRHFTDLFPFR